MSLREEIEQIIYDDDGKMPAKGTVDAIVTLIENEKAKQREKELQIIRSMFKEGDMYMDIANRVISYIDGQLMYLTQTGEKESKNGK